MVRFVESLLVVATCVVIAGVFNGLLPPTIIPSVFLLGVLAVAVRRGIGPALLASALSYLALRFFFGEPYFDLGVSDPDTYAAVTVFLVVSLVVGTVGARLRDELAETEERARRSALLYELSRGLTATVDIVGVASTVTACVEETAKRAALVLLRDEDGRFSAPADPARRFGGLTADDLDAAQAVLMRGARAQGELSPAPGARWVFLPIGATVPGGAATWYGVLAVRPRPLYGTSSAQDEARLFQAICDQAAVAVERVQFAAARERARLLAESERLRNTLLASVSHDLRTPLASIMGAGSSLLELQAVLDEPARNELLETVLGEAERLDRCVTDLLDMTRIEHGKIEPKLMWCDVRDVVSGAVRHLKRGLDGHEVTVEVAADFPLLLVDPVLLGHIVVNLIDNARKFSPAGAPIALDARRGADGGAVITVDDLGPGIPAEDRERIFEMFRRLEGGDTRVTGTGLGLAICRGFADALGGRMVAIDRPGGSGTRMLLTLPARTAPELPQREEPG